MKKNALRIPGGYVIAIEGIDAVGKNTHTALLYEWLERREVKSVKMSFPDYTTPIGREIESFLSGRRRNYPIELQHLLFAANRWEKSEQIRGHLNRGETIIVDRYTESNLAYGKANGLELGWLAGLEKGLPAANLVIVLDASPHTLSSRRPGSSKDAYEKSLLLQSKAQEAYRELAHGHGWKLIDAAKPVGDVRVEVIGAVKEALSRDRGIEIQP
jgi:dTMP kinase